MEDNRRLMVIGAQGGTHVGQSFRDAAKELGLDVHFLDTQKAFEAPALIASVYWRLWRKGPRMGEFGRSVAEACSRLAPRWLLATGLAPLDSRTLTAVGQMGIRRLNYLTDDPWNPNFRSSWFFDALTRYDRIFSVRRLNISDLSRHGCQSVNYLPFGYDPAIFYPEPGAAEPESDILFAGGADADRLPYIRALIGGKFRLALYGGYWHRFHETRSCARGLADAATLRRALSRTKAALCLVRRANRDGHVMRTFEIPAVGACMLTEDTAEHRDLFGDEGQAVLYFRGPSEMEKKLRWLLEHETERRRLANSAHRIITGGRHTYKDRLRFMLELT